MVRSSRFRVGVAAVVLAIAAVGMPQFAGALPPGDAVLAGSVDAGGRNTSGVFVQLCQGTDCTGSAINAGSYAIPAVAPGTYTLYVQAFSSPDFLSGPLGPVTVVSGANTRDVVLSLGGRVSGTVTNPDGSPLAGAAVTASVAGGASATAFSAPDGSFTTTALPAGSVQVRAFPGGYEAVPTVYASLVAPAVVTAGVTTPVGALRLRAAGSLSGQVVDSLGGRVAGAVVSISAPGSTVSATTGTDGRYQFASLEPGARFVSVTPAPGVAPIAAGVVTIPEGAAAVLDVTLPAAASLTGTFARADGTTPAAAGDDGVIICPGAVNAAAYTAPLGFCAGWRIVGNGTNGLLALNGVPPGTYSLAGFGGGYGAGFPLRSVSTTVTVTGGSTATCTFVLAPQATPGAAGCTVAAPDTDGVPAAIEDAGPNGGDGNLDGILDSRQTEVASLPAAVGGGYLTVAAPAGTSLSAVSAIDPATLVPAPPVWTSFPAGLVDFTITGVAPGGTVTVKIYRSAGGPAANAWFKVLGGSLVDATGLAADPAANPVVLTLTDNGFGDDDPTPGVIRDPSGAAVTDRTPPTLACVGSPSFRVGQTGALVQADVADTGSGPVQPRVSVPADTSTAGSRSAVLQGADRAGNTASTTCAYTVERPTLLSRIIAVVRWILGQLRS